MEFLKKKPTKIRLLVTGKDTPIGSDVFKTLKADTSYDVYGFDSDMLNINNTIEVLQKLEAFQVVVNCMGFTDVDAAESNQAEALALNTEGPQNLALACTRYKSLLVHFSSDYVFDGAKKKPYTERDIPNPMNLFGTSKLAGEKQIKAAGCSYLILRTQSLFSTTGENFVTRMLLRFQMSEGGEEVRVADDQISSPTYTADVAQALLHLLKLNKMGTVNVAASGECSWFEFANYLKDKTGSEVMLAPSKLDELALPAKRPLYSVLDSHWYGMWTNQEMPTWQQGLDAYLKDRGIAV